MTPNERIDAAWAQLLPYTLPSDELRQLWVDTITSAVEAEREACAQIVEKRADDNWRLGVLAEEIRDRSVK